MCKTGKFAVALPKAWMLLLVSMLIAACGTRPDPPPRQTFLLRLDPAAAGAHVGRRSAAAVVVAPVLVAAPFSGRSLVVRQSEFGFEADPYAEFAASPVSMWTDAIRGWLDTRQLFERVLPVGSSGEATLTLETSVLEAVIDRRPRQPAASRVTIRFLLIRSGSPYQVLLDRTFVHAEPIKGSGAESEVAALSVAANDVLRDFEGALVQLPPELGNR